MRGKNLCRAKRLTRQAIYTMVFFPSSFYRSGWTSKKERKQAFCFGVSVLWLLFSYEPSFGTRKTFIHQCTWHENTNIKEHVEFTHKKKHLSWNEQTRNTFLHASLKVKRNKRKTSNKNLSHTHFSLCLRLSLVHNECFVGRSGGSLPTPGRCQSRSGYAGGDCTDALMRCVVFTRRYRRSCVFSPSLLLDWDLFLSQIDFCTHYNIRKKH